MSKKLTRPPADDSSDGDTTLEPENLQLILAEMDSLRSRMKLLEARLETVSGGVSSDKSTPRAPLASVVTEAPTLTDMGPPESTMPGADSTHRKSHRSTRRSSLKKRSSSNPGGGKRLRRKSRTSKTKKNLLLVYGLVIGGGLVSVFAYMMVNLFSPEQYLPSGSNSAPLEITIDETPDLEELRRSIQDGEE